MKVLFSVFAVALVFSAAAETASNNDIRDRIKPFGSVCIAGQACPSRAAALERQAGGAAVVPKPDTTAAVVQAVAAAPLSGPEVYSRFCATCHAAAVAGAPLVHSTDQWAPRLAKGMDTLMQTTRTGINAMPPKGMCMACSDAELQSAIDFMAGPAP